MSPLRLGVVGVGGRALIARHAESAPNTATVVVALDPDPRAVARVENRLGKYPDTFPLVTTMDEFLAHGLDGAIVTSPDDTHAAVTVPLLEAGVPVYLEKPIDIHLEEATAILTAAYETGTKLYVGHNMRHMSVVRTMRDLIRAGRVGEVKAIWCRHFVGNGGDYYFKDWHAERAHTNSLLLQKAAHDLDVMHWLADSHTTEVVAMGDLMVYGQNQNRGGRDGDYLEQWFTLSWPPAAQETLNETIDVEDVSMMLMRMDSGVLASYEQCHFTPDYWRNYTVIGTEGRLENFGDGEGGVIKLWNKRHHNFQLDGDEQFPITGDRGGHTDADLLTMTEFLTFITDGGPTDTSPVGAWYSAAAGIQAAESLRSGSTPRQVPALPEDLVQYFLNHQVRA